MVVENVFKILVIQATTWHQRPRVVRSIEFTCMLLHNMLRIYQGGAYRVPTPANDVVALYNDQVVYVTNENYRNPSREAK